MSTEPADFEELVERGTRYVEQGVFTVDQLDLPAAYDELDYRPEFGAEDLREAVREAIDATADSDPATEEAESEPETVRTSEIDWPALWREFGFHTPDAAGNVFASNTQLVPALEASAQHIGGDPRGHIRAAVEQDILERVYRPTPQGETTLVGYALPEVLTDE